MELTLEQINDFAEFMTEFNKGHLTSEIMHELYGFFSDSQNTPEAIESYLVAKGIVNVKELWGEDLYSVFSNHISDDGWLTCSWGDILEREISKFDENYNHNPEYKNTYSKMYLMDFRESVSGEYIRPVIEDED